MTERQVISYTIARAEAVAPEALLATWKIDGLEAALIYSPDACRVARVSSGEFRVVDKDETEQPADLSGAYEIRAFGPRAEVRWIRDGATGTATLLSDDPVAGTQTQQAIAVLPRTYLVWGEPINGGSLRERGWSTLGTARVGKFHIPCTEAGELALFTREYVVAGEHGNAVVLFERLEKFGQAPSRET